MKTEIFTQLVGKTNNARLLIKITQELEAKNFIHQN